MLQDQRLNEGPDRVEERHVGRRGVLAFIGELDSATAPLLDGAMARAVDAGLAEVWLDLSGATFIDSTGVHLLLRAQKTLAALNRRLVLICPEGQVLRVLRLTDVLRALERHPTRAAAQRGA